MLYKNASMRSEKNLKDEDDDDGDIISLNR